MNVTVTRSPRSPTLITTKARSSLVSPWSFGPKKKRELYRDDQAAPLSCPASTAPQSPLDELPASRRRPTAFRTESPSNQQRNAAVAVVQSHHDPAPLRSLALLRWPAKELFLDGKPPIETLARMGGGVADFFPGTRPAGSVASGDTPGEGEARGVFRSGPVASGDSSSGRRGAGAAVPVAGSLPYAQATRGQHQCRQ